MIFVVGWPRSGTSLLMQLLAAGGLDPVVGPNAREPRPFNPHGVWEIKAVEYHVRERGGDKDAVVKVFHFLVERLALRGLLPAAAIISDRDPALVAASAAALWPDRQAQRPPEALAAVRARTLALLERENVPSLDVDPARLVADPAGESERIAAFLEPVIGRKLDVAAMALVPEPAELHR